MLTLKRRQLDVETGTVRLEPGTTRNDDGRVVYLTPELKALIVAQLERVTALERETGHISPIYSLISEVHTRGRGFRTLRRRGKRHVWRLVALGCYGMASGALRCGTWSTWVCLSA
jgi:hypothetical protein